MSARLSRSESTDEGEPLSPDHIDLLRALIPATRSALSEYSAANLVLFAGRHDYRFLERPVPHVRGIAYDGARYAMPLAPVDRAIVAALLRTSNCIAPLGDEAVPLAAMLGLACGWNDDDGDYVYDSARLAALAGAKTKRAQARAFLLDACPKVVTIENGNARLAAEVLEGWFRDVGRAAAETDLVECRMGLALRDRLGLEGLMVLARGHPVAFLLAGPSADGNRIIHFAKGRRAFPGACPWLFAHYAATAGVERLNFEQDLGKPGFARAKRAFAPAARLRKYRLRRP